MNRTFEIRTFDNRTIFSSVCQTERSVFRHPLYLVIPPIFFQVCRSIQSVLQAHETRHNVLKRLEEDRDLFTSGKVSRMRAAISSRRASNDVTTGKRFYDRSDGVTDDDDDVAY